MKNIVVTGAAGFTSSITTFLEQNSRSPRIILPSSSQAALDNPYGTSKKAAEDAVLDYQRKSKKTISRKRAQKAQYGKKIKDLYSC